MHIFGSKGIVYRIVIKLGKQVNMRMLAHLTDILILNCGHVTLSTALKNANFQSKRGTERHVSQMFFVRCCFTSMECYIMPPFNHVHMLTETVKSVKMVTWPTKCLNISKRK